ncbi:MAG: hypothetical protein ACTSUE_04980 [Promethearchaeota archaeon]
MGRFIFYVASQAYHDELRDAFPLKGVSDYGKLFHDHGLRVTWFTNAEGARRGREVFTKFHDEFGDEVIMWARPVSGNTAQMRDHGLSLTKQQVRDYILEERAGIKEALPFARLDHVGWFYRTRDVIDVLEELGFKSCYGHCWEMIATDGVTDNGVPWGMYYMDPARCWKRPRQDAVERGVGGIIANEWLQHDLNKSWNHFGSCSVFSFDPNDVERAKICDGRSIQYWRDVFRDYYRNREWNDLITFVFHQEAHEQESTPGGWEVYPPETVQNTFEMTDEFLNFLQSGEFPDVEFMTLVQASDAYRDTSKKTIPTYMLVKDFPIDMPVWNRNVREVRGIYREAKAEEEAEGGTFDQERDYGKFSYLGFPYGWQGMLHEGQYPDSFVYFDTSVQLFFHDGNPKPVKIWNYLKDIDMSPRNLYYNQYLFLEKSSHSVGIKGNEIVVELSGGFPYGICLWGDHSGSAWKAEVLDSSDPSRVNVIACKPISDKLLFIRVDLPPGTTTLLNSKV